MLKISILFSVFFIFRVITIAQVPARTGHDFAVFFAVKNFQKGWTELNQTLPDAKKISNEIINRYGFQTQILENPRRGEILEALNVLTKKQFSTEDQLLLFFSMHGYLKDENGYLIPSDGDFDTLKGPQSWVSHDTIRKLIEKIPNAHILVVLDACYSGAFSGVKSRPVDNMLCGDFCFCRIKQALGSATQYYLTAGGREVVPSNSVFAQQFVKALQSEGGQDGILTFAELYSNLEVIIPVPRWGTLNGHRYGNFIFVSKNACEGAFPSDPGDPGNFATEFIEEGAFEMGDLNNEGNFDEFPVHEVKVSDFWIDPHEVTFEMYDMFCKETGRTRPSDAGFGRKMKPIMNVSWYDAIYFCNWRSEKMGLKPCYVISKRLDANNENQDDLQRLNVQWLHGTNGFRLPTEAEWEYAARAQGHKMRYANGKEIADSQNLNCRWKGSDNNKTQDVGSMPSNSLGLYEMSGNVAEWCWDWYGSNYFQTSVLDNPSGPISGKYRVVRGGSFFNSPYLARVTARSYGRPDLISMGIGFRCVRSN